MLAGEDIGVDRDATFQHRCRSGSSVGPAVVATGVGAAVGRTFTVCGAVGAAVVAVRIGTAVGRSLTAGAGGGDVVVIECHR